MKTRNGKELLTQSDFTPAHREGLRRKYDAGASQQNLADDLDCSRSLIGRLLRKSAGYKSRSPEEVNPGGYSPHSIDLARKVQHHTWLGEDAKAISKLLGKCTGRIHQLRKIDLSKYPEE
jgi:hypothetical protein